MSGNRLHAKEGRENRGHSQSGKARPPAGLLLPTLTAEEVEAAKIGCARYIRLDRARRAAEKARDAALFQIFFKMGFASLEEVKALSPERLTVEIQKRADVSFSFDSDKAREFAVLKTWAGRFPAWKDQFLARVGPAI